MAVKPTFICPYCFEKVSTSQVEFRCTNARCPATFEDLPMTKYLGLTRSIMGKKTYPSNSKIIPQSCVCPECKNASYKRICPMCHNELPESTLSGRDMIISVVGTRSTGKSHFVGVIIKELRDRIAPSFEGSSIESFADSNAEWQRRFGDKLYRTLERLPKTDSNMTRSDDALKPLIYKFKTKRKKLFGSEIESITLVFFDTAGEDLNQEDTMSTVNKYICKSAGIIFLLDPMQIPAVVNQLDDTTVKRASGGRIGIEESGADDIMVRVSNLIRNDRGLSETDPIDIPVAAVFSKFDAVVPLVPQGSTVLSPSNHCPAGKFDMSDWHNVNSEILALLNAWDAGSFVSQLQTNYKKYSFFAISALGLDNNPTDAGKIQRPRPHRIEDPLLWILKENKVIK